jgi:hypothetical protein
MIIMAQSKISAVASVATLLLIMLCSVSPVSSLLSAPTFRTTTLPSNHYQRTALSHRGNQQYRHSHSPSAFVSAVTVCPSQRLTTSTSSTSLHAVEGDFDPNAISQSVSDIQSGSLRAKLRAFYKFTRPHTIRGTILASIAGTTRALIDTPGAISTVNWGALLPRAVVGMIALLLGNAFIVGINQIYDKDIDVLNKPFLPVASGEMSERVAWGTVLSCGILGPSIV